MKRSTLIVFVIVMLALVLTTAQVLAAPAPGSTGLVSAAKKTPEAKPESKSNDKAGKKGKVQHFKGTVAGKTAASLTITLDDGSSVTVGVNGETKVKIPTVKDATLDSIQAGVRVNVQARADASGSPIAQKILVVPGKPTKVHRVGVVTAYSAGSITIQDKDGGSTTFIVTTDTKILPKHAAESLGVGVRVTIISRRDPAGGPLAAQGIVIHGTGSDTDEKDGSS
jgi:hypothetical protein